MWLENLKELRAAKGNPPYKQLAEKSGVPERTVTRIFSGETENPGLDHVIKIVNALDGSLSDIFEDTKAVVGRASLAELQRTVEGLTDELALASAENAVLQKRAADLTTENDILRLKLEHKEELLALHNYYMKKASE